jgi:hypothetical protein
MEGGRFELYLSIKEVVKCETHNNRKERGEIKARFTNTCVYDKAKWYKFHKFNK